jgi:hypothetical protein
VKSIIINALLIIFSLSFTCRSWAQPDKVLLSFGLNVGVNYPINQFAKVTADNPYGGKVEKGGFSHIFAAYHLSKYYRITGGLVVNLLRSQEIDNKMASVISNYTSSVSSGFTSASLIFGHQKNFYLNGRDEFTLFVRPSIGIQLNRSNYERKLYIGNSGQGRIFIDADWKVSPVFALNSGIEFGIGKHFLLILAGNYSFSHFGTEDVWGIDQSIQNQFQVISDVNLGWVHQAAVSIGFGMNLFKRKR